jgi:hypothetical protein
VSWLLLVLLFCVIHECKFMNAKGVSLGATVLLSMYVTAACAVSVFVECNMVVPLPSAAQYACDGSVCMCCLKKHMPAGALGWALVSENGVNGSCTPYESAVLCHRHLQETTP